MQALQKQNSFILDDYLNAVNIKLLLLPHGWKTIPA